MSALPMASFMGLSELPFNDVHRQLLRQVLNELKGTHNKELEEEEWQRIIDVR